MTIPQPRPDSEGRLLGTGVSAAADGEGAVLAGGILSYENISQGRLADPGGPEDDDVRQGQFRIVAQNT